jgi:hypothetical protein
VLKLETVDGERPSVPASAAASDNRPAAVQADNAGATTGP